MTKEELIKHLEHLADYVKYSEDAPALREVIEMLECSEMPNGSEERTQKRTETRACDCISRSAAVDALGYCQTYLFDSRDKDKKISLEDAEYAVEQLPSAQPDTEKICARIKAEAIKRNVEYMKHGDRYMLGFVDGMRLARRIVDGTVDDPVYFTTSGE